MTVILFLEEFYKFWEKVEIQKDLEEDEKKEDV